MIDSKIKELIGEFIFQTTSNAEAIRTRMVGFPAEYLAETEVSIPLKQQVLNGGFIIPLGKGNRYHNTNNNIYLTILSEEEYNSRINTYIDLYKQLGFFKHRLIVTYKINENNWNPLTQFTDLEYPEISTSYQEFVNNCFVPISVNSIRSLSPNQYTPKYLKKNQYEDMNKLLSPLNLLNSQQLENILINRYIFDYELGYLFLNRGIACDFDMINKYKDIYCIFEIKEKYPSYNNGFGMDKKRIDDYEKFMITFPSFQFRYLVRHIQDKTNRIFIGWKSINMKMFIDISREINTEKLGGTGMTPNHHKKSNYTTLECPLNKFKVIK